jgi:hypothetical protein
MFRTGLTAAVLAALTAVSTPDGTRGHETSHAEASFVAGQRKPPEPPKTKRWRGTASATCKCSDGRCVPIVCTVTGQLSYEAARSALKYQIEAQATSTGGHIEGSISFSISAEF